MVSALVLLWAIAVPKLAFAADLSVKADTSVKTGDTVTLTVVVSDKSVAVAQGAFTYDPKLLKYVSSDGGASDGTINLVSAQSGGASSLTAVIKFKATAAGNAKINVSMQSLLDYNGKTLEKPADAGVSVKVTAAAANTEKTNTPKESKPAADYSKTGIAAKNIKGTDTQMYIWRSIDSLTLPSGYYDKQVAYGGETIGGATTPDNEGFTLLYLSEKTGKNAGFYIYIQEKDYLYPYVSLASVQANFTILWPDDSIKAPQGFEKATLQYKERDMPAWTAKESGGVYLVYARNASGDTGFFLYNSKDKSVQRYETFASTGSKTVEESASNSGDGQKNDSGITIDPMVFFAICIAGLAFFTGMVIFIILYKNKNPDKKHKNLPVDN
jgi:hypothetical protein